MTDSATDTTASRTPKETGIDDLAQSLRSLTRSGRALLTDGGNIVERELAMAITISERLRGDIFSENVLEDVRSRPFNARLRADAHRAVELVADVGGVLVTGAAQFARQIAEERRPPLRGSASPRDAKSTA
jgi:hypothetical protein